MAGCLRIAFAGGGTGGHLYPAINLARMFEKSEKCEIIFFGTDRGLEAKKIPELGYKLEILNVRGFHREFSFQNLLFFFRLLGSLYKSKKILKNFKPHVVIGTGGYVMGPALKMAIKLGITTVIQEQNSFPGVTTRMLAKDVDVVFTAYKQAADHLKHGSNIIEAGNPVFIKKDTRKKAEIFQDFGLNKNMKTIMVFGGSQGAASINSAIKRVIDQHKIPTGTQVFWQCGYLQYEKYKEWLVTSGKENVQLTAFIDDMWSAYQIADFCICRAGAMSIAELELATLPAILIPLKSAAGNHQFKNARVLEQRGCAKLIEDNGLLVHRLIEQINHLTEQPLEIKKMRENLAKSSKTDGGQLMVDEIYKILKEKNVWPE